MSQKSVKKNFELNKVFTHYFLCQNNKIFIKFFELYLVFQWENVLILSNSIHTKSVTQ